MTLPLSSFCLGAKKWLMRKAMRWKRPMDCKVPLGKNNIKLWVRKRDYCLIVTMQKRVPHYEMVFKGIRDYGVMMTFSSRLKKGLKWHHGTNSKYSFRVRYGKKLSCFWKKVFLILIEYITSTPTASMRIEK